VTLYNLILNNYCGGQIVADGEVELSDGTKLRFRTTLIDIKEIGFSYFDGVILM